MNIQKVIIGGALISSILAGDAVVSSHSQQVNNILCGAPNKESTTGGPKIYDAEYGKYYICKNKELADAIESIRKDGKYNQIFISTESGMKLGNNKIILKLDAEKGGEANSFFYLYIKDTNRLIDLKTEYLDIAKEKGSKIN